MIGTPPTAATRRRYLRDLVAALEQRLAGLVKLIGEAELQADSIWADLRQIKKFLEEGAPVQVKEKIETLAAEALRRAAAAGVRSLLIRPLPGGAKEFKIDNGKPFALPPVLAELLTILAGDAGPGEDGLVTWKTPKEVANALGQKAGRSYTRAAVNRKLWCLKQALSRRGVNPYLVQTHRRLGRRFAVRPQ